MKRILAVCGLGVMALTAFAAHAEMSVETARASVAPFYKALNAEFAKDSPDLVRQATAPDWVSCRDNDVCNSQIKEVLVSGNQVIVRGEATGTPAGEFMGAPHTGKSFKVMSIDVHTLEGGKMARSYHIEDWMGAVRQLTTK